MTRVVNLPKGVEVNQALLETEEPGVLITLTDTSGRTVSIAYPEREAMRIAAGIIETSLAVRDAQNNVVALPICGVVR